ncbi:hypothetical protein V6257_11645 [Pseudoalteromonas issachenkonii]|uniref:Uncharacterized protein n=1 Tax=Pseudoalteromonas issachenkonii TaxID=152297 RepID=A0ABU9H1E9_9GAMM|nr:hypothetical protein [Pseudoalteromonas sp. FUC4]
MRIYNKTRQKKDLLGTNDTPADVLDGIQIQHAINKSDMQIAVVEPCSK